MAAPETAPSENAGLSVQLSLHRRKDPKTLVPACAQEETGWSRDLSILRPGSLHVRVTENTFLSCDKGEAAISS